MSPWRGWGGWLTRWFSCWARCSPSPCWCAASSSRRWHGRSATMPAGSRAANHETSERIRLEGHQRLRPGADDGEQRRSLRQDAAHEEARGGELGAIERRLAARRLGQADLGGARPHEGEGGEGEELE